MQNQTFFQVQSGTLVSDCMQETYAFIEQNLEYFNTALQPAREALASEGSIAFISHETQWSFACRIDRSELGKVASGIGVIVESNTCPYDELLTELGSDQ